MFNPLDGANYLTGTFLLSAFGVIAGTNPLLLLAAPVITGLFMVLCKVIELAYRARGERQLQRAKDRIAELEAQVGKQTNR